MLGAHFLPVETQLVCMHLKTHEDSRFAWPSAL